MFCEDGVSSVPWLATSRKIRTGSFIDLPEEEMGDSIVFISLLTWAWFETHWKKRVVLFLCLGGNSHLTTKQWEGVRERKSGTRLFLFLARLWICSRTPSLVSIPGDGAWVEPLQPGFATLQSNPLLYSLTSWNKQDSDKMDCANKAVGRPHVAKQLIVAEDAVSWARLTEV